MSNLINNGKDFDQNAHGDQCVTMETQHAKNTEIDALKNTIKFMKLEHKNDIQEKDIQILTLQKENGLFQILNLEHEIKILKGNAIAAEKEIKEVKKKNQEDSKTLDHPQISFSDLYMETEDLILKGIARFFRKEEETNGVLYNHYHEWFQIMACRIGKNIPIIHEQYVLVKLKCKDPSKEYIIVSYDESNNNHTHDNQWTRLDILNKGWNHDTASLFILHPTRINKSITMGNGSKCTTNQTNHQWKVDSIPKEYRGKDDCFIVLFLKT